MPDDDFIVTIDSEKNVPEGIYKVRLLTLNVSTGNHGPTYKAHYEIAEGAYKGAKVVDVINRGNNSPNTKLAKMIKAFTGEGFEKARKIDLKILIGKEVWARIEKKDKGLIVGDYGENQ